MPSMGVFTIELESLAVAWAMEKFHYFLYGNHFLLENCSEAFGDHTIKKLEPGYTQTTENTYKNISLKFHCVLPARFEEPTSRLFAKSRGITRLHQTAQAECISDHWPP